MREAPDGGVDVRRSLRGKKPVSDDSGEGAALGGVADDESRASAPVRPIVGAGAEPLADSGGRVKLDRVPELLFCCLKLFDGDLASLAVRRDLLTRIERERTKRINERVSE